MLLKDFGLQLTKTQAELAEKFTAAFYEAQNTDRDYFSGHEDVLSSFDEHYFDNVETYEEDVAENDYLLNFLVSKADENDNKASSLSSMSSSSTSAAAFDYEEFSHSFDEQQIAGAPEYINLTDLCWKPEDVLTNPCQRNSPQLFCVSSSTTDASLSNFDDGCFDLDNLSTDYNVTRNDTDFSTFLRHSGADSLSFTGTNYDDDVATASFGHLIGNRTVNNNHPEEECYVNNTSVDNGNQILLYQDEALLRDDPLLSSSNVTFSADEIGARHDSESSDDCRLHTVGRLLQCKWEDCYQVYESQTSLVRHIEKTHVELKRGEEFTCFWANCPRQSKPFNARYKLLIHMRVHSGEKPNKCPFDGCTKAFSRLENLKIHQRSHTGERPYLCQFADCTKSFSNSSDRAKHQRTHFDTKPYACQVLGCVKKYTDPSSLRKHVKNHTYDEQMQVKKKNGSSNDSFNEHPVKKYTLTTKSNVPTHYGGYNTDHSYTNTVLPILTYQQNVGCASVNVKQDLKNKISEKRQRRQIYC